MGPVRFYARGIYCKKRRADVTSLGEKEAKQMLSVDKAVLVVIDVQEKLFKVMSDQETLLQNTIRMTKGAEILEIPVMYSEQNPKGLGPTLPEVKEHLGGAIEIAKLEFSCCGNEDFMRELKALNRSQVLILGMECHVCVYQTAADLVSLGYEVQVIADAVSSRTPENKAIGLERCSQSGAGITGTETALFELLKKAEGDKFKKMLPVVK
jgi:nicotinamidase-related amidase